MMKLIIEISEDVYEECQGHIYFPDTGGELFNAVKKGTPLDKIVMPLNKIADEINRLKKVGYDEKVYVPINAVFDIIDKHKAEREE